MNTGQGEAPFVAALVFDFGSSNTFHSVACLGSMYHSLLTPPTHRSYMWLLWQARLTATLKRKRGEMDDAKDDAPQPESRVSAIGWGVNDSTIQMSRKVRWPCLCACMLCLCACMLCLVAVHCTLLAVGHHAASNMMPWCVTNSCWQLTDVMCPSRLTRCAHSAEGVSLQIGGE